MSLFRPRPWTCGSLATSRGYTYSSLVAHDLVRLLTPEIASHSRDSISPSLLHDWLIYLAKNFLRYYLTFALYDWTLYLDRVLLYVQGCTPLWYKYWTEQAWKPQLALPRQTHLNQECQLRDSQYSTIRKALAHPCTRTLN